MSLISPVLRIVSALPLGAVFFVYSEEMFWCFYRHGTPIEEYLATYLVYVLLSYVFLYLLYWSQVYDKWGVFLIGAIYGWIIEGFIVQTMYEAIPLSISWTALAWHAGITILIGFYNVFGVIRTGNIKRLCLLFASVGVFWGLLSTFWIIELGYLPTITEFFMFISICSVLISLGYYTFLRTIPDKFSISRPEKYFLISLFGIIYACLVLVFVYILVIWTPLVLFTLYILKKYSAKITTYRVHTEKTETLYDAIHNILKNEPSKKKIIVSGPLLIPPIGTALFAIQYLSGIHLGALVMIIAYIILVPLGFLLYVLSVYKCYKLTTDYCLE